MNILRIISLVLGLGAIAMGLLWIGQGTGLILWPAQSFMLAQSDWAWRGALLAALGLLLVWRARRRG